MTLTPKARSILKQLQRLEPELSEDDLISYALETIGERTVVFVASDLKKFIAINKLKTPLW